MPMRLAAFVCVLLTASVSIAADRRWQTGTWVDVDVKRRVLDFGPGSSGFGRPNSAPPMRAMADVHTYVIEAGGLRLELENVVQVGRGSLEAVVGQPVTFAVHKKTVYVRDAAGGEHKLRLTKKTAIVRATP